jgi:ribosomal protein L11 methyltransferase
MSELKEKLYNIKIESGKVESAILEEMLACLNLFPTIWQEQDSDYSCQNLYHELEADAKSQAQQISDFLKEQRENWGLTNNYSVKVIEIDQEDWSEVWKKFFHTKKVSDRFVIKPSWEEYTPVGDELIIDIDPGMSFGTGQHGTTQACLQFIDDLCKTQTIETVLDAGCGSGILSIGLGKLAIEKIVAFDHDEVAVKIAQENLQHSGLLDKVDLSVADLAEWSQEPIYDLVIANILCVILLKYAKTIAANVKPGGWLILAGSMENQYKELHATFHALGFREKRRTQIKEWSSGIFQKTGSLKS